VAQRVVPDEAAEQLRVAAATYVTSARALGFGAEAAVAAVRDQFTDQSTQGMPPPTTAPP
jgi:hypothetical protein